MTLPVEQDGNFVWSDELNGVVVFKHGKRRAWVNFMFRDPASGVNDLTRIHFTTPVMDRMATVRSYSKILKTRGNFKLTPNAQYADHQPPHAVIPGLTLFWAGQKWPLADRKVGGRADLFMVRYGKYLIFMNTNANLSFDIDLASVLQPGMVLKVLGKGTRMRVRASQSPETLNPRETVVLCVQSTGQKEGRSGL